MTASGAKRTLAMTASDPKRTFLMNASGRHLEGLLPRQPCVGVTGPRQIRAFNLNPNHGPMDGILDAGAMVGIGFTEGRKAGVGRIMGWATSLFSRHLNSIF